MDIKRYQDSWAREIADLFHSAVHAIAEEHSTREQKAVWAPTPPDYAFWSQRLAEKRPWVAVLNGRIAGFIELDDDGHIDCAYTHPEFQGQGIASALYRKLEAQAKTRGLTRLYVEASKPARRFFAARGFLMVKRNEIARQGVTLINYTMEKPL
ncbi:histone acetyltransferase [Pseudoalteromonas rubra]|uniref:Histone acetyltransferase n=1 Tax=Pseudoalteromonas rubra TaxID=43658 RepID=A0A5S3WFB9_9GAMM|nr:GNAT family N-acetyltransferase [Pseudoalteromonas rubra]TMP24445.1 histone acetyltransferase [Pseudoalteromonas rubra]TMP33314.1 histone acetyltransferase [Pseudoalteromonas rubra]